MEEEWKHKLVVESNGNVAKTISNLSRCSDYMRPAYGHKVIEFKRHNVFAATTNETNFL